MQWFSGQSIRNLERLVQVTNEGHVGAEVEAHGMKAKFKQSRPLHETLMDTTDEPLYEATKDPYWGIEMMADITMHHPGELG